MVKIKFWYFILLFYLIYNITILHSSKIRQERSLLYKLRSIMGIFVAIAVPVDLPNKNVFFSYNFEGNYYLPYNLSELEDMAFYIPITDTKTQKRSLDRKLTYDVLEKQISRLGYSGRSCLLRTICEVSQIQFDGNGVLSTIAHIVFTPSTSKDENLTISFYEAERSGRFGNCNKFKKACPKNILDHISEIYYY